MIGVNFYRIRYRITNVTDKDNKLDLQDKWIAR